MILKCDFCSAEQEESALHRHRARAFEVLPRLPGLICTSEEDWAACDTCHSLIEANKWDELAERSARALDPEGSLPFERLKAEIKELHWQFRENRL